MQIAISSGSPLGGILRSLPKYAWKYLLLAVELVKMTLKI